MFNAIVMTKDDESGKASAALQQRPRKGLRSLKKNQKGELKKIGCRQCPMLPIILGKQSCSALQPKV